MTKDDWSPELIVVGVDGSDQSRRAAAVGAAMAKRNTATLHLLTVVRPPEGWWGIVGSPPTPNAMAKALSDAQRSILDAVVSQTDLNGVEYEALEDVGDPAKTLVAHVIAEDADVLIVGRHGAGLIERLVLGSVAHRVIHDAPCPVLLVP